MKRKLSCLLVLAMVVNMICLPCNAKADGTTMETGQQDTTEQQVEIWDGTVADSFAGGDGSEDNPYLISNGKELALLSKKSSENESTLGVFYKLTADIYLNDISAYDNWGEVAPENVWTPIKNFSGYFNGNDHSIKGMYINKDSNYAGLFANIDNYGSFYTDAKWDKLPTVVESLDLSYVYIQSSAGYVGSLAGHVGTSTFRKIYFRNITTHGFIKGNKDYCGGIFGYSSSGRNGCYMSFTNLINRCDVEGGKNTGGISGYAESDFCTLKVEHVANYGNVKGSERVGGVFGFAHGENACGVDITESFNKGEVIGERQVGGITGYSSIGAGDSHVHVINSYNAGNVTCDGSYSGGISGEIHGYSSGIKVQNCYTVGLKNNETPLWVCDSYGYYVSNSSKKIYDTYVVDNPTKSNEYIIELAENDFADNSKFTTMDFENVWEIDKGLGRPILKKNREPYYDYSSELYKDKIDDFVRNKGTMNVLKYLCNDSNFTNSVYVYENDSDFASRVAMSITDMYFRGIDGWKDIFAADTSIESAEQIIVGVLQSYEADCLELSRAKTARKYAKAIVDGFEDYMQSSAIMQTHLAEVGKDASILKCLTEKDQKSIEQFLVEKEYDKISKLIDERSVVVVGKDAKLQDELEKFWSSKQLMKSVSKGLKFLKSGLKLATITQDTINYVYEVESLKNADDMYCEMLQYLKENCSYSVVQVAASNLLNVIEGSVKDTILYLSESIVNETENFVLDKALDLAITKLLPLAEIVKKGFDWGVTIGNWIFHTGDTQELKDNMRIVAYLGSCLASWSLENRLAYENASNDSDKYEYAKKSYYSLYMLWKVRAEGENILQSMMKKSYSTMYKRYSVSKMISTTLESYKDSIFTQEKMVPLLGIEVACPVDVEVIDKNGNIVAQIIDGKEDVGISNGIYYYVDYQTNDNDYVKYIYFDEEKDYQIKINGKSIGTVNCSVFAIGDDGKMTCQKVYNIPVDENTKLKIVDVNENGFEINDDNTEKQYTSIDTSNHIGVEDIELETNNIEMIVGEQMLLSYKVIPSNASDQNLECRSSDDTIVTVNNDGVLKALKDGDAVITVCIDDKEKQIKIHVTKNAETDIPAVTSMPTTTPTNKPSVEPSATLTSTATPTNKPSVEPSVQPTLTATPMNKPSVEPSIQPTPTATPMNKPSVEPSIQPTSTATPTNKPSVMPSITPTPTATSADKSGVEPTFAPIQTPAFTDEPGMTTVVKEDLNKQVNNRDLNRLFIDKKSGFTFRVSKNVRKKEVQIVKYAGRSKNVLVPDTIKYNGIVYTVTGIGKKTFKNNKYLKRVVIGNNIRTIGKEAFMNCKKLKMITIGKRVTNIQKKAFYKCKKMRYIMVKSNKLSYKSIKKNAFAKCYKSQRIKTSKKVCKKYLRYFIKGGVSSKSIFIINPVKLVTK